jgi:hypothetical protein
MSEVSRYTHINTDGLVVNVSLWDGVTEYDPGKEISLVKVPDDLPCGPGWSYVDGEFIPPAEPEEDILS